MGRHILVTGATCETGHYTTDLLISQGEIRAFVHKAEERSEKLKAVAPRSSSAIFWTSEPCAERSPVLTPLISFIRSLQG